MTIDELRQLVDQATADGTVSEIRIAPILVVVLDTLGRIEARLTPPLRPSHDMLIAGYGGGRHVHGPAVPVPEFHASEPSTSGIKTAWENGWRCGCGELNPKARLDCGNCGSLETVRVDPIFGNKPIVDTPFQSQGEFIAAREAEVERSDQIDDVTAGRQLLALCVEHDQRPLSARYKQGTGQIVPCPGCGARHKLIYRQAWEPVPGYPTWTDQGAPPYAWVLRPAIEFHQCSLREQANGPLMLPDIYKREAWELRQQLNAKATPPPVETARHAGHEWVGLSNGSVSCLVCGIDFVNRNRDIGSRGPSCPGKLPAPTPLTRADLLPNECYALLGFTTNEGIWKVGRDDVSVGSNGRWRKHSGELSVTRRTDAEWVRG